MVSPVRSLRLPKPLQDELEREFTSRGIREWSAGVIDLLTEAIRMRRVPGIVFVDSATGRRAAVAGTGLDVWEIIATWNSLDRDEARLTDAYGWLTPNQLRAALSYYASYGDEVDERIRTEERWGQEEVRRAFPFTAPRAT